jgi:class 3 adenylate cyclase
MGLTFPVIWTCSESSREGLHCDIVIPCVEVQNGMVERNAGLPPERRIEFRVGIHLGDVVEESDGDLMGDGVNIAARLEGMAKPGAICLSEDAYRQSPQPNMRLVQSGPIFNHECCLSV